MKTLAGPAVARALCLAASLGTLACTGERSSAGQNEQLATSLAQIAGSWDIARFDNHVPARLHEGVRHAYVEVDSERLSYALECNHSGNRARLDQSGTLHDDDGGRTQTLMGCSAERSARDRVFFGFFASRPKVFRAGARVRMSNGRSELLLERPELRRLAHLVAPHDLVGRWVPQTVTAINPKTGSTGESVQRPATVVLEPGTLLYSGCGGARFTFRYSSDGRLADVREQGRADCGNDFAGATLLRIIRSQPLVERDATGLALTAGALAVSLASEGRSTALSVPIT